MSESDYSRCARAVTYLAGHVRDQPSLADVAALAGLSPFHFQRVFQKWVGVSPKRFLQYLTLEASKDLLAARAPLLEVSQELGLSSPSRLHDLFLGLEGLTPGQFKARARGLRLAWTVVETPFGPALAAALEGKVCALSFLEGTDPAPALAELGARFPRADLVRDDGGLADLASALRERFGPEPRRPLGLILQGSPFQLRVWEALLAIPEGRTVAYGDLAARLGAPGASRAVGAAVGRNPIAWLIPCHRVIRASGALGGYHWGLPRKQAMLALERARTEVA